MTGGESRYARLKRGQRDQSQDTTFRKTMFSCLQWAEDVDGEIGFRVQGDDVDGEMGVG